MKAALIDRLLEAARVLSSSESADSVRRGNPAETEKVAELEARQYFNHAMIDAAKASVDRAYAGADAVRNAAAAIGAIYTAVLGVAFSVNKPLPPRGVIPAIFLGSAIVLATAYVAFPIRQRVKRRWPPQEEDSVKGEFTYTATFIWWITDRVFLKAFALRAAILSLAFGVAFLPVGFIAAGSMPVGATNLPAWPSPPLRDSPTDLDLALYQVQVAEVASQRQAKLEAASEGSQGGVTVLYWAAGVCGLLVFAIPLAFRALDTRRESQSNRPDSGDSQLSARDTPDKTEK